MAKLLYNSRINNFIFMDTSPLGVSRPAAQDPKDSRKTGGVDQSGYRAREMDEKARKEREDKQRKLILQKRALELKEMDLRTQEDKHSALRREITKLENQSQKSTTVTSGTVLNTKNFERQSAEKIAKNENKIKGFEQEIVKLKREDSELGQSLEMKKQTAEKAKKDFLAVKNQAEEHQRLLQQKTQEAILAVNRINGIKEEIKMIQSRIQTLQ
jgi:chromosome segregation ATPase